MRVMRLFWSEIFIYFEQNSPFWNNSNKYALSVPENIPQQVPNQTGDLLYNSKFSDSYLLTVTWLELGDFW